MKQTLKQRLGTGIVYGAIGLGSLFGISGCEYSNETDVARAGTTSLQYLSKTPEQALFWGLADRELQIQANREDRRIVAGEYEQNKESGINSLKKLERLENRRRADKNYIPSQKYLERLENRRRASRNNQ